MFKNKYLGFTIVASIILTLVMVSVQIPYAKSKPRDVPVAIVNEDAGAMGSKVVNQIESTTNKTKKSDRVLKWHEVSSKSAVKKSMDKQHYYGALVIPKDFSQKMATLIKNPKSTAANIDILINQQKNSTLATSVQTIMTTMVNKIGAGMRGQIVGGLEKAHASLPAATVNKLANPITTKVTVTHKYSKLASANSVFFQPIWLTSLVSSLLLYFAFKDKNKWRSRLHIVTHKTGFMVIAALVASAIGFLTTGYVTWILGYNFSNPMVIGSFMAIASFAFIMLFSGFIAWLGFPAIILFVLLLFFSIPLMSLAPQLLPSFYQHYILPWLPMRFLFDGAKSLLFYHANLWNSATSGLIIVMVTGMAVFFLETFSPKKSRQLNN